MSDLEDLARDLTNVARIVPVKVKQSVQQAAMRTKGEWRKLARGNPLGRQYTATIDYTVDDEFSASAATFSAEVGPDLERYGGKTGRGGLVPSAGVFDDPISPVKRKPDRARRGAEQFAARELSKGIEIALDQSLQEHGL